MFLLSFLKKKLLWKFFLNFFKKWFSDILGNAHFPALGHKIFPWVKFLIFFSKRTHSEKKFIFWEIAISSFNLKKLLVFWEIEISYVFSRKSLLIFWEKELFLKKLLVFKEVTFRAEKNLTNDSDKMSYILADGPFYLQA